MYTNVRASATRRATPPRAGAALLALALAFAILGWTPLAGWSATSYGGAVASPWPSDWNDYRLNTGTIISDVNGDQSPDYLDLASGTCTGTGCTGPEPTVMYAFDSTTAFFRVRLATDIRDASKGGLFGGAFLVQLYSPTTSSVVAAVGVDGKSASADYVYVTNAVGGSTQKVYEWPFDNTGGQTSGGMRVIDIADGTGDFFLDFQMPLSFITAVSGGVITSTTPVKLYYGSSAAANLATINKDFMLGSVTSIDWSSLSTVSFSPASVTLASSATHVSGPNPPQETVASAYTVTVTATNPGGGRLTGATVTIPAAPSGVVYSGASTAAGTISGSPLVWNIGNLDPGQSVTATFTATITPALATAGSSLELVSEQSVSGTDAPFAATRTATAPAITVGTIAPATYYTVSFDSHGGTSYSSQSHLAGELVTSPGTPSLSHYTFLGWYTAASGGSLWSFASDTVSGDTTLHAQWSPIMRDMTFDSGGGSAVSGQSVLDGDPASDPGAPTRTGYVFTGWYTAPSGGSAWDFSTPLTGDVTLYAQWTPAWAVTFNSGGGSAVSGQSVLDGDPATAPADPTRSHYTFAGWFTAPTGGSAWNFTDPITGATTLYAQWTAIEWTVTFDGNGGSATGSQTVLDGDPATSPANPTQAGYVFEGWFTAPTGGAAWDFSTAITSNVDLYAQWSTIPIGSYAVDFEGHGGSVTAGQVVTDGDPASQPSDPTRSGYVFNGWYTADTGGTLWNFADPITGSLTLHAQWTAIEWTVAYDGQGGSATADETVLDTFHATRPADPTRAHYTFAGWYTAASGGSLWDFDNDEVTADTTLYAAWTPIQWTVSFASNGGDPVSDQTITEGDPASSPTPPTRAGYVFAGWYTAASGGSAWDFTDPITGDTALYAHWLPLWTVTFDSRGGSAVSDESVADGSAATEPADPTLADYAFLGWFDAPTGGTQWDFEDAVNGDVQLYAHWQRVWSVTFTPNGGSSTPAGTSLDGDPFSEPIPPSRPGYAFQGWSLLDGTPWNFGDPVTGPLELYATWSALTWNVSFDGGGGSGAASQVASTGALVSEPTPPTRSGYRFVGWFTSPTGGSQWSFADDGVAGDVTLYARWVVFSANEELAGTGATVWSTVWWSLGAILTGAALRLETLRAGSVGAVGRRRGA